MRAVIHGFLLTLAMGAAPAPAALRIAALDPTPLFPRQTPLRQVAVAQLINDADAPVRCRLRVQSGGEEVVDVPPGVSRQKVLVPDLAAPDEIRVEALEEPGGRVLASIVRPWQPQRKWKVYIVKSAHEDLGYEDFIYRKQQENATWVDIARRLSNPGVAMGRGEYSYTLESILLMRNYVDERSVAKWRDLAESSLKTGQMELMGAPSGVHSHWMDYEELARMTYPGRREVRDRYGLDLKTFMMVDNPSLSWAGAQAVAESGFRYVARWGQGWRTGGNNDYPHTKLPPLFWWQAPDGEHRVLFTWRSHYGLAFWYGQGAGGYGDSLEMGAEWVTRELQRVESGAVVGPYPYDAIIYPSYVDHAIPHVDERVLPAWNRKYAYPEIRQEGPTRFFEYIEQKYGGTLPVLSGDLNNFSSDYASIDPESQAWKREAARSLPVAEGLAAIGGYLSRKAQPVMARAARIWTEIFDYDEHSWPTQPKASDDHLFNASWIKHQGAERAVTATRALLDESWRPVAENIPVPARSVIVLNSLAHARDGLVSVAGKFAGLVDTVTGQAVVCEITPEGRTLFVARGVPAYGYKVFREAAAAPPSSGLTAAPDRIENQHYAVRFDRKTGNIVGILDKSANRELVDSAAKYQFNQMVYVHKQQRESKVGSESVPPAAHKTESRAGPVRARFIAWIDDPQTGAAIHQTVTVYNGLPRIDIENDLQHARRMYSDNYEDRYCENIFYAFPVNVPGGQPRVDYAAGVVRPYDDQLRWGTHDNLTANRWVDVSTRAYGVTIAPWNESVFHFGEIRYNQFSIDYKPSSPHLYSYAWSNRMAGLLTRNGDETHATVGYSLRGHGGDWNGGDTTAFGWSVGSPLLGWAADPQSGGTLDAKQSSILSVDAPNVQLTVLKNSEQPGRGWIARFIETEGKATEFALTTPGLPVKTAMACDLVENDLRALTVAGGRIRASIRAFGHVTIRLTGGDAPGAVAQLRAQAETGERVSLSWTGPAGAMYHVYRSLDPKDPPTAYTLIARTAESRFTDDRLDPGAVYSYRVAAVTRENVQGDVSAPVEVRTRPENAEAPAPVTGLTLVRLAPDRLIVVWNKSDETDVARYVVYRGESAGFDIASAPPVAVVPRSGYFLETCLDSGLAPGTKYFYKVAAEDWAGHRQTRSPVASAVTPAR